MPRSPSTAPPAPPRARSVAIRAATAVVVLGVLGQGCGGNDEEVGDNRARGGQAAGQGGSIGELPGSGGQGQGGDTSTGSGGSVVNGGSGATQTFAVRGAGLGRSQMGPASASEKGPAIRFGGVSPLGRVCNGAFCVTGDLR